MAVVIDDMGRDLNATQEFLTLDADLTFSVLPHARYTRATLEALRKGGREFILHLPMMPVDSASITDEPVVVGLDGPLQTTTEACLNRVPGAVGLNNHMGSKLSQDPRAMTKLMSIIKQKRLWMLDSRTTHASVICQIARSLRVPCLERDVFLDDPPQAAAVQSKLKAALHTARQRGWSIAIGHPRAVTKEVLSKFLRNSPIRIERLSKVFSLAARMKRAEAT